MSSSSGSVSSGVGSATVPDAIANSDMYAKWRTQSLEIYDELVELEKQIKQSQGSNFPLVVVTGAAHDFFAQYALKEKLKFVVVGPTGGGKSALINWLIGQQVAPISNTNCTARPTRFFYSPQTTAYFQNEVIFRANDENNFQAHLDVMINLLQTLSKMLQRSEDKERIAAYSSRVIEKSPIVLHLVNTVVGDSKATPKRAPASVTVPGAKVLNDIAELCNMLSNLDDTTRIADLSTSIATNLIKIRDAKIMFDLQAVMRQHLALPADMRGNALETFKVVSCGIPNDRLRSVDLWDIPGYGENQTLDDRANNHLQDADVVICLIPKAQWNVTFASMIETVIKTKPSRAPLLLVLSMFDLVIPREEDEDVAVSTPEDAIHEFKAKLVAHFKSQHISFDVEPMVQELCLKHPQNPKYSNYLEHSQEEFNRKFAHLTSDILKSTVSAALVHLQEAVRTIAFAFSNPKTMTEQLRQDKSEASKGFDNWKKWIQDKFCPIALKHANEAATDPAVQMRLDTFSDPEAIAHEFYEQILARCRDEIGFLNDGLAKLGKRITTAGPGVTRLLRDVGERWFSLCDHATRAFYVMNPIHFFWRDTSSLSASQLVGVGALTVLFSPVWLALAVLSLPAAAVSFGREGHLRVSPERHVEMLVARLLDSINECQAHVNQSIERMETLLQSRAKLRDHYANEFPGIIGTYAKLMSLEFDFSYTIDISDVLIGKSQHKVFAATLVPRYGQGEPREVAVKQMITHFPDPNLFKEVVTEALIMRTFCDDGRYVPLLGARKRIDEQKNHIFELVMDRMEGDVLAYLEKQGNNVSDLQRLEFAIQVAEAIESLHRQQVLHRDIKPRNVFVTRGEPRYACIGDFGDTLGQWLTNRTFRGTYGYMAPETYDSRTETSQPTSSATDIFALGVTIAEILHGEEFHLDLTGRQKILPRANPLNLAVVATEHIVKRCIDPEPLNRPAAFELVNFLREARERLPRSTGIHSGSSSSSSSN